jgi:hypothetical protein
MKLSYIGVVALVLLGAAACAWADLPGPFGIRGHDRRFDLNGDPPPLSDVPVVIVVNPRATEARLVVPKEFLGRIAAVQSDSPARVATSRWTALGVPLAASLAIAGLCLTGRRPRLPRSGLVLLLAVIVFGGVAASLAWGRALLPDPPPPVLLNGKVTIEVVEDGNTVNLVLNRDMLKDLMPNK